MRVFTFFAKKKEGRELSNFWEGEVVVDGRVYSNGELAFHGSKYVVVGGLTEDGERREKLVEYGKRFEKGEVWGALGGKEAKSKGGKKGMALSGGELELWDRECVEIQKKICSHKLQTDEAVKSALLATEDKLLVHPAMRCSLEKVRLRKWEGRVVEEGGRRQVVGGNMLGNIWMECREKL